MITRKNHGAPSSTTPGNVGDYYIDIDTGKVYQCVDVTTQGDDLGFVTVYANGGKKNTTYIWKSTGASSYNELEDKPFYEEEVVVNEPLNITWDGNTEGLVSVGTVSGFVLAKVSDLVLTDEQIKSATVGLSTGESVVLADIWDAALGDGIIVAEDFTVAFAFVVARKAGVVFNELPLPEVGIYFIDNYGKAYTSYLTTTEPIEQTKTVIHPIDPKFLPDNVGGGIKYVTIGEEYDENDNVTYTASATYDEIA